jgi:membrane protein
MHLETLKTRFATYKSYEIPLKAAALSYHTVLSIVPAVGLIFWYLQKIGITEELARNLQDYILSNLNVSSSQNFVKTYTKLTAQVRGASWGFVGILVLIYTAYNLLTKTGNSIDSILEGKEAKWPDSKHYGFLILRRFSVMMGLPVAILCSSFLGALFRKGSWLNKLLLGQDYILPILSKPVPWVIDMFAFFVMYLLVPKKRIPSKEAFRAALFVTPIFEIARSAFTFYNTRAITSYKIYGTFAAIPMFLVWINFGWIIILSGALVIRNKK